MDVENSNQNEYKNQNQNQNHFENENENENETIIKEFEDEFASMSHIEKNAMFIEKLRNSNYNIRLYCVKRLTSIAELLGPNRCEEELIPLLIDSIMSFEDNDEVLIEISNQFINLVEYLPNKRTNVSLILKGLELLAGNDDELVRQQATDNLCKLINSLDENTITNEIFPLMQRLIQNDMKSKVSCCYLFPVVYPSLNNEQIKRELIQAFHEISRDDSPSVRRAAAHNIKNFALIDDEDLLRELVGLHSDLLKDNIDIVKVFAVSSTKNLLIRMGVEEQKKLITNFNTVVNKDKSWRVKYAAAETICDICSLFDQGFNEQNFLPIIMLLLKDSEAEVRASVLSKFDNFVNYISPAKFFSSILPIFQDTIGSDHNYHVRSLFALCIVKCCKYFNAENFEKSLFPLISKILKDDVIEVRNSALQSFEELTCFFKNENIMLNAILPSIIELSKDLKWRIRLTLIEKLDLLADILPEDLFLPYFLPITNNLFSDHAFQIREVTFKIYEKLNSKVRDFIPNNLWTLQKSIMQSTNYILRISSLNSIDYLKSCYDDTFLITKVIPFIFGLKDDKVANVKFSLCKVIKSLFEFIFANKREKEQFRQSLEKGKLLLLSLGQDDIDVDVRFFSSEAIQALSKF